MEPVDLGRSFWLRELPGSEEEPASHSRHSQEALVWGNVRGEVTKEGEAGSGSTEFSCLPQAGTGFLHINVC